MSNEANITFSVIIPVYNGAATIARAIDSCLQQSYPAYEIIVVNDASTDDTAAILDSYGDKIKHIQMLQNNGVSVTRNKGLNAATGSYIAFLDADDVWHVDKLQIAASVLSSTSLDFLYHNYTLEDINTVAIPEGATLYRLPFVKLLLRNHIATPCAIIKNNPKFRFTDSMRHSEDYDLWLRIAYKHKAYFIDIPLTQLGRPINSAGGASSQKWKMRKGELRAFRRLVQLNPLFIAALPFLYAYSLGKHMFKLGKQ